MLVSVGVLLICMSMTSATEFHFTYVNHSKNLKVFPPDLLERTELEVLNFSGTGISEIPDG